MSQYFKIGKFAATHGLKGELVLVHSLGKKTAFKNLEALFIEETKDNFMPYFIEDCSVKNDSEVLVKIEGIDTKEVARKLSPKEVWMAADDFNKYAAKTAPISMLGYDIIDGETNLGEIIEVIEQPHQLLCTILYNGNEALIPVHQNNLVKMDVKNKKVYVDVPDGLLEIYG